MVPTIKVWEDRWLPAFEDGRIRSPRKPGSKIQRVCELIRDGKWDQELLGQEFEETDRIHIAKEMKKGNGYCKEALESSSHGRHKS